MTTEMSHVVLLGDSIFDNAAYVAGGSSVLDQLRSRLPRDWRATLLACDGADVSGVLRQLNKLPEDASHLAISIGGNNALEHTQLIRSPVSDPRELLSELADAQSGFRKEYREMLRAIRNTRIPALACTVYDAIPDMSAVESMALSLFNDVIVRELAAAHLPILDLRSVCNEARDYSSVSPIEPSEVGGSKIARALQRILTGHDWSRGESVIYT